MSKRRARETLPLERAAIFNGTIHLHAILGLPAAGPGDGRVVAIFWEAARRRHDQSVRLSSNRGRAGGRSRSKIWRREVEDDEEGGAGCDAADCVRGGLARLGTWLAAGNERWGCSSHAAALDEPHSDDVAGSVGVLDSGVATARRLARPRVSLAAAGTPDGRTCENPANSAVTRRAAACRTLLAGCACSALCNVWLHLGLVAAFPAVRPGVPLRQVRRDRHRHISMGKGQDRVSWGHDLRG